MATRGTSFYVPAIAPGVPPGRLCYGATCALEDYVGRRGLLRTLLIPEGKPLTMPVVVPLLSSFRDRAAPSPMRVVTRAFLPRYTVPDLESWATGTSRCLSKTRSRSYADEFSGGTRIAGATPPRPWSPTTAWDVTAATGYVGRPSVRNLHPARPGTSKRRGEVRHLAIMKHVGEHIALFDIRYGSAATHEHQAMEVLELA